MKPFAWILFWFPCWFDCKFDWTRFGFICFELLSIVIFIRFNLIGLFRFDLVWDDVLFVLLM